MKVAITGSIACGKSTVTSYLLKRGYKVLDADKISHSLLEKDNVKEILIKEFSDKIITDNFIDRKKLGEIVFSDEKKLEKLNSIMHPLVRKEIEDKVIKSKNDTCFIDIALLFEAKFDNLVDKIIVVHADYDVQLSRLMNRNNFSKNEAKLRIASQISSDEKIKLADYVVNNSGTIFETFSQVDDILNKLEGEIDDIKNR